MNNPKPIIRIKTRGVEVLEGAGVRIHRLIGTKEFDHIDPFVLLDEFKSSNADDYIRGFPTHPHRGIETITYMIRGSFRHEDSQGNGGLLTDGCTQWMTAGRGILHSEMPEKTRGLLWGYQLWLSLPAKDKMTEPGYQHISPEDMPTITEDGFEVKIISGQYGDVTGPAQNIVRTDYFDIRIDKGKRVAFPSNEEMSSLCYVHTGSVLVNPGEGSEIIHQGELVAFIPGNPLDIKAVSDKAGILYLSARPNNEPIVRRGPFVMNSPEEIAQAFIDYENGVLHNPST